MKDKVWLKLLIVGVVVITLVVIVLNLPDNSKKETKKEPNKVQVVDQKKIRNSERILWETFLNKIKKSGFIHEDNLEYFELVSITDYGKYLKAYPNYRFEQINYTFKCKDDTQNCVDYNLRSNIISDGVYAKLAQIDLTNKNFINLVGGFVFNQNDELVSIEGPFVYEGEED